MEKKSFLDKYGMIIIIILLSLTFLQTCGSSEKKLKREIVKLEQKFDSLCVYMITKEEFRKELRIEGLKNRNQMIQATHRTLADINQQKENQAEIERLEKE